MTEKNTQLVAGLASDLSAELDTASDEEQITIRRPKDENERLFAALNSTDEDLYPQDDARVYVTGKNKDGESIFLGFVDELALYKRGANPRKLIDRIRFGV